jgi:hypothetical protein
MAMYKIVGGDKREYGPVSGEELRRWLAEGRLNSQSLAQAEGTSDWKPLASFAEFADALRAQTGQSPPLTGAPPAPPVNLTAWSAEILAREPHVRIGGCLARSWNLWKSNFGLLTGGAMLLWLVSLLQFIPLLGGVAFWILGGVLYGGLYLLLLKRIRGEPGRVSDVFFGFKVAFGQLVLVGAISVLLEDIGFCFCLLPWVYLSVAWVFGLPLAADKRLEFWSALELSRKVVTRVWFEMFGLMVLAFSPLILAKCFTWVKSFMFFWPSLQGLLTSGAPDLERLVQTMTQLATDFSRTELLLGLFVQVVVLLNLPFAAGALMYAYEDLFGARTAPAA